MARNQLYVVLSNSWWRRPATTKRRLRRRLDSWEHFCLCGSSSTEQILQTVHSQPALSLLRHIVCALAFHSGWGGEDCSPSHWANSGERSLPSLLCSQENLPFIIFYLSSKLLSWADSLMSESWINCFKPKRRATHHQTLPEMFYWRLLKLSRYTRCTNIGQQNSVFSLLLTIWNHVKEKLGGCFARW